MKLSVSICVHQWLKNKLPLTCVLVLLAVITSPAVAAEAAPIDAQATPETVALFHSLRNQMGKGILFGQQNSTLYGVGWHSRNGTKHGRSDCFDAVGAYPAVYGWDLNRIWNPITPKEQIPKNLALVKGLVVDAYERGGVNTFSWHIWNPLSDEKKSFYDTSKPAVKAILPGGEKHEWYKAELDRAAAFFQSLKTDDGTLVPIIFRPWHEHNGGWFWWGLKHCGQEDYNRLFRFTVTYLRDEKQVHNLLYAISPSGNKDKLKDTAEYLKISPGKDYVDLYGFDAYAKSNSEALSATRTVVRLAEQHGKIAAMTEGGYPKGIAGLTTEDYTYTRDFLGPFKQDPVASRIAFFLVWQNSKQERHWIPIKGSALMDDFKVFAKDPAVIFGDRVKRE